MEEERYKIKVAVNIFLIKDNKILLGLRQNTGFGDGKRGAPGGRLEDGESFTQCGVREAKEEVGIEIKDFDLKRNFWIYSKRTENPPNSLLWFWECNTRKGECNIAEPHKCNGLEWFDIENLPNNMMDDHKLALEMMLSGKKFLERGF